MKKLLTLSILTCSLYAQTTYSVDELVVEALHNAPNLKIAKLTYDANIQKYNLSYASYLPKVNLEANALQTSMSDVPFHPDDMKNDTLISGQLTLSQIIYDFGGVRGNVESSNYTAKASLMQSQQFILNKKRDVKEAYYKILEAQALIDVQKENLKLNEAQLYRAKRYYEAGIRTKIDVSDAKVSLIKAKIDLKKAQYTLKLAYANLDKVVGFETVYKEYNVYIPRLNLDTLYSSITDYDLDLEAAVSYAYEHRLEMQQQRYLLQAQEAQIQSANAGYYPSLYLLADYTKQHSQELNSFLVEDKWDVGINLSWNLYAGGATKASTEEKKIQKNIASTQLRENRLLIKQETTNAYIEVQKSKDSLELSQSLVSVSNEKFDQASKRYEHGLSDFIELQQARQGYIDAKASLVIDYYNYYIAKAYLDNAIGK